MISIHCEACTSLSEREGFIIKTWAEAHSCISWTEQAFNKSPLWLKGTYSEEKSEFSRAWALSIFALVSLSYLERCLAQSQHLINTVERREEGGEKEGSGGLAGTEPLNLPCIRHGLPVRFVSWSVSSWTLDAVACRHVYGARVRGSRTDFTRGGLEIMTCGCSNER